MKSTFEVQFSCSFTRLGPREEATLHCLVCLCAFCFCLVFILGDRFPSPFFYTHYHPFPFSLFLIFPLSNSSSFLQLHEQKAISTSVGIKSPPFSVPLSSPLSLLLWASGGNCILRTLNCRLIHISKNENELGALAWTLSSTGCPLLRTLHLPATHMGKIGGAVAVGVLKASPKGRRIKLMR